MRTDQSIEGAVVAAPNDRWIVRMLRRIFGQKLLSIGLVLLVLVALFALVAPLAVQNDPYTVHMADRLKPPSWTYPLGTDSMGRCMLTRLAYGAQSTLGVAALAVAIVCLVGVPVGLLAGYARGRIDAIFMRLADGVGALPEFLWAIAIAGFLGPSLFHLLIAIIIVNWISYARVVRGIVLSEREKEYVLAARAAGAGGATIIRRHLLPQVVSPVVVMAALDVGSTILIISSMSYLGLGAQPPIPEWGAMLNDGRPYFQSAAQLMIIPGVAIMTVVIAFQLTAEGLRDRWDVRGK
ncbi:nickel transporter permease [Paenibacillus sp. YYML68]|uniref:nickel transporter permease n=1 Tax=Paenibacillus sp. YYML68 TaxID=2909250 RepID=UPI002491DE40|nr:nickel transporter permease [Paenibacillus sp. YYML68]